jgi:hypothetical protein
VSSFCPGPALSARGTAISCSLPGVFGVMPDFRRWPPRGWM